jgi:hypothetical protein
MNKQFSMLLIASTLVGCSDSDNSLNYLQESPLSRFTITVPPDSKPNLKSIKYVESENAIYGLNYDNQSIYVHYLGYSKNRYKKIKIIRDGPLGVGEAHSLSVISKDSIFLAVRGRGISMIDESGGLVQRLQYDFGGAQVADFTGFRNRCQKDVFLYRKNTLFFPQRVPNYNSYFSSIQHKPIGFFDYAENNYSLVSFQYPETYWKQRLVDDFSFTGYNEDLYFGLANQHFIWKINASSYSSQKIMMKSISFPETFIGEKDFSDINERTDFLVSQPNYSSILIDSYRNLIYRVAIIPYDDDNYNKSKSIQLFRYPDNFTVIVCRTNGEYIGEFIFPSRTYYPYGMFVTEERLNIPKSHPEYLVTHGSEDELEIEVFNLNK